MQTLTEIFSEIGNHSGVDIGCNDKGGLHTYLETYDRLFEPFREGCFILEIGLALGDSLILWNEYFKKTQIFGIDISIVFERPKIKRKNDNYISIIEADATNPESLRKIDGFEFDIAIDDGSHMEQDQIATFNLLKPKMKKGGIYIIEDILAIDQNRHRFESLHDNCEIIDMRHVNNRFDNVLIIFYF